MYTIYVESSHSNSSILFDKVVLLCNLKLCFKISIQAGLDQGLKKVQKGSPLISHDRKEYINYTYPTDGYEHFLNIILAN